MARVDEYASVDLTEYRETMYVSKNKDLKRIVGELKAGKYNTDNPITSKMLLAKQYKEYDAYLVEAELYKWPGVRTFFNTLQQLLYLKYFAPANERLPRDCFQTAMGILQARWAIHKENCRPKDLRLEIVQFHYWEDLTPEVHSEIVAKLVNMIGDKMYETDGSPQEKKTQISNVLKRTVWYAVATTMSPEIFDNTKVFSGFSVPSTCFRFFPVPETIRQFSLISCIYVPEIVFGILSSATLFKHIVLYECRPYVGHLPNSKSNLCDIHTAFVDIFRTWFHDIVHSSTDDCTDGLNVVNSMLGRPPCDLPAFDSVDTFRTELRDRGSKLNACIRHLAETKPEGQQDDIITTVNDLGLTFGKVPTWGGFRKKSKKRSKRKRRRTRRFI
jgi:hypothetical protein